MWGGGQGAQKICREDAASARLYSAYGLSTDWFMLTGFQKIDGDANEAVFVIVRVIRRALDEGMPMCKAFRSVGTVCFLHLTVIVLEDWKLCGNNCASGRNMHGRRYTETPTLGDKLHLSIFRFKGLNNF